MNIYFWDKPATIPEKEDKDKPNFNVVEEDQSIREVVRNIENKIIGTKRTFSETKPDNPSVKKWIRKILEDYPNKNDEIVDDILNEFRSVLRTRSKEKEKIVGILQLNDTLVIVHCKKDPSLAEIEDKLYSVKTVLHPKNIIRADIIKNEDGTLTLFAFESSRKWSKGHAKFWGIEPEDVGWESIGSITLNIELVKFRLPVQIPIEVEQLKELIDNGDISVTGKIRIGQEEGKITKVFVYGKAMTYSHFYDFFVTGTEKIENYKKKFRDIIPPQQQISAFDKEVRYRYEEDKNKLYEITTSGSNQICKKEHLRFTICFFTKERPGIKPMMQGYLWDLYQSVFENKKLEIWHAGEESTLEPLKIGSLEIYNQIEVPDDISVFSNNLLNQLQDAQSKKTKLLLQYFFCKLYSQNIKSKHFNFLFDFFIEELISKEIEFEFKNEGLLEKENLLEFKSVDDIKGKPTRFAKDMLVPTVRKYLDAGNLKRYCILYGVEDNGAIKPIVHLKSDQITEIENLANKELSKDKATVCLQQIPFKEGLILAVFLIPQIKGYVSDYENTN